MTIYGKNFTENFMAQNPYVLGTHVNRLGQLITFYEHPTRGDEAFVYGMIDGILFNTGFMDLDDMTAEHGEYTPEIEKGALWCGDMHEQDLPK